MNVGETRQKEKKEKKPTQNTEAQALQERYQIQLKADFI